MSSDDRQWVRDYFEESIERYTVPCLRRLMNEVRPDENGLQGCSVSLALTAFAVLDLFGFLLRPAPARREETSQNLGFVFIHSHGLFDPLLDEDVADLLIRVFRHGVVHQYFPKSAGISKAGLLPLLVETSAGQSRIPILNVDALAAATLAFLGRVKARLLDARDIGGAATFCSRLSELIQADRASLSRCMYAQSRLMYVEELHWTPSPDEPDSRVVEPRLPVIP